MKILLTNDDGYRAEGIWSLARELSKTVDLLLSLALDSVPAGKGLALLALGGYGRGELNPFSDVDVMILYPEGAREKARDLAGPLLGFLWDLGYTVGRYEARRGGPGGEVSVSSGTYLTVWQRQSDGTWKVLADLGNSDPPDPLEAGE